MSEKMALLNKDGSRLDGRGVTDLRPLKITAGVLNRAAGSCLIEWGRNKVLAAVYGPHEVFPKHLTNPRRALINARYIMAPFSSQEEHGRSGPNRRSIEISKVARHVFENVVFTERFPKTMIDVHMEVLQSDGGTRVSAITAASVALADAGIPMRDLVCGVSVGRVDGKLVVDLDKYEDNLGESDVPVVISPRTKELLLFQLDGLLSKKEVSEGLDMIFEAANVIREKQVQALADKFKDVDSGDLQ
ncbi:exosome complex exonuclease Rrp41 [Candidatus Micrarchaeota archaeon]|nr:exosome complex exonuclease Rrp41 [Candidatus Micrarchaeota archaeon]